MKIANISIRRPVLATVLNLALMVMGLVAFPKIGVDLFPEVDFPVVTVTTVYPGADPEVVEDKVVDKLEEAINTLSGIEKLRSVSLESVGQVIIQFSLDTPVDQAAQDVRAKVSAILADLPADIEQPIVEKFDIGAAPIMSLTVSGTASLAEITRVADDVVKARLQKIDGIGAIDLVGGREREVHVLIDRDRLAAVGLTLQDVTQALKAQNLELPGGRMELGARELSVKTKGEVTSAAAVGRIVVTQVGGAPIRVRDVATVEDTVEEARSASTLAGTTAVALVVRKQSGANTVSVAEDVRAELTKMADVMPEGVAVNVAIDNSLFIAASIHDVQFDLLFGALLTVFIILAFLRDWRATLISAIALPTSIVATIAFISVMGFTFNNMTMLALTLSVGILIDDAIVVIENIHRHLEMGKSPMRAARDGTAEIGLAVMAITAAIIAVFVPVATMDGIIGRFFFQFGMTVSFAVAVSLLVSFTLTPMLAARFLSAHKANDHKRSLASILFSPFRVVGRVIEAVLVGIERAYAGVLAFVLRQRFLTILAALGVFAGSIKLAGQVKGEFLPAEDRGEFTVNFELPTGSSLAATEAFAAELGTEIGEIPGVELQFMTIGGGDQGQVNKGSIHVGMVGKKARAFDTMQLIDYTRARLGDRAPAQITVDRVQAVSGGGNRAQMVQFNIRGTDFDAVSKAALDMKTAMAEAGGYVDLDTTYRGGKPELRVEIDRDRAADLGVPVAVIAGTVRTMLAGDKISEVKLGGERVDVRAWMQENQRSAVTDLGDISVRGAMGELVKLDQLVKVVEGDGPAQIDRSARQRQVTVLANLQGKTLGAATQEIEAMAKKIVPASLTTDWEGQADTMKDSMIAMITALLLAIILVYLILAAQFESFVHPLIIMFSLPLATVGAFGALYLFDMSINIFSMIGFIMLIGLVTKNAVLLVDYTNVLRDRGAEKVPALIEAGKVRLRPILMTTAAMVFGMLPVATATSLGGETRAPMAVAVIGGLLTSTLLTLVVVPVIYSLLDRFSRRKVVEEEDESVPHAGGVNLSHA